MIDIDFTNILRLDGCFKFLNLQERINLHQSRMSPRYFNTLPEETTEKFRKIDAALKAMEWEIPAFHTLREDECADRYWVYVNYKGDVSEAQYAKTYADEFNEIKKLLL